MFNWLKRKPAPQVTEEPECPRIVIELDGNGNVTTTCSWPDVHTLEEARDFIQAFAMLIFLTCNGKLLAPLQHCVASYGTTSKKNTELAKGVLTHLNQNIESHGGLVGVDPNRPVVSPIEVFSVRGGGNQQDD